MTNAPTNAPTFDPTGGVPVPQEAPQGPMPYDPVATSDLIADIDTTDVDVGIPEGWYLFQLSNIEKKNSKSGNPKFEISLKVAEGAQAGRMGPRQHFVYAGSNPFSLVRFLKQGFGVDLARGVNRLDMSPYRGRMVYGRVQKQEDNPQYNEVKEWRVVGEGAAAAENGGQGFDPAKLGNRI